MILSQWWSCSTQHRLHFLARRQPTRRSYTYARPKLSGDPSEYSPSSFPPVISTRRRGQQWTQRLQCFVNWPINPSTILADCPRRLSKYKFGVNLGLLGGGNMGSSSLSQRQPDRCRVLRSTAHYTARVDRGRSKAANLHSFESQKA